MEQWHTFFCLLNLTEFIYMTQIPAMEGSNSHEHNWFNKTHRRNRRYKHTCVKYNGFAHAILSQTRFGCCCHCKCRSYQCRRHCYDHVNSTRQFRDINISLCSQVLSGEHPSHWFSVPFLPSGPKSFPNPVTGPAQSAFSDPARWRGVLPGQHRGTSLALPG